MKVFVVKNNVAPTNYALIVKDDEGNTVSESLIKRIKRESNGTLTLVLPENPLNRNFVALKKVQDAGDTLELEDKIIKAAPNTANKAPRTPLEEFLEGEEREMYIKLRDKAIAAAQAQAKADAEERAHQREIERKRAALEKARIAYEELLKGSN